MKIGIDLIDKHINGYKVRVQHLKLRNCDFMMTEDSQIQQLIDHFSQLTLHELNKQFGDKGGPMHKLFTRQFKIHYNNYEHMLPDPLAKRHGVNSLFVMALDDVMCEIRASFSELKETVISIYRTMLQEFFKTEVAALEQSDNPWEGFVEWARKGNKANYDNEYFQVVEVEQETGCFGFDIQKCLYFDILRESGKPELGPILCDYDNILAGAIENWIVFTRHETIASGDKRCTFRYCKQ
ncbi:MAG: L-2-amino-thiazoline-4-carboxylic acid hydrolase [Candidatus Thorarchaeota archaeon]